MADNNNKPAAPGTTKTEKVRKFEAVSTINLGKGDIRPAGATITDKEISPADLEALLAAGRLRDGDAPIPPSQAEGLVAFARLLNIAKKIGVVKQDGGAYTLGGITAQGLAEFRSAVTLDDLETAIVAKAKG
jgi:hypothetical protein